MKVSCTLTVKDIAQICNGFIIAGKDTLPIQTISTDSRNLGENTLFIPLIGENFDGHNFVPDLILNETVAAILTMKPGFEELVTGDMPAVIECNDTLQSLGFLGNDARMRVNPTVIGITGTNGKTTTKELLSSILSQKHNVHKNIKNYNNEVGLPFTLLALEKDHEMAVVEMGMNHSGELQRLSQIARPDCAVVTNVGEGHLEFLGTVENVALAKAEIFSGMEKGSFAVINKDSQCFDLVLEQAQQKELKVFTYGLTDADFTPESYELTTKSIKMNCDGMNIEASLYGMHNLYNILAAVTVARIYELSNSEIEKGCTQFEPVGGRSQIIEKDFYIINDTYNANPLSTISALQSVKRIFPEQRKVAVLSDMKELGESASTYHREVGKEVVEAGFDLLLLWGEFSTSYADGAKATGMAGHKIFIFNSKESLSAFAKQTIKKDDVVLVKGSRSMKMEDVVTALSLKE